MEHKPQTNRPSLEQALSAWQQLLAERRFSTDLVWVFDENLCFEKDPKAETGFRLGFQTKLTPPPPEAHRVAYEHFAEYDAPLVWYRLGSNGGKSICTLLCDPWFQAKTGAEGFVNRPEWLTMFWPGKAVELEEITDKQRWENRLIRERPVRELDFGMTLRSVHEVLAHGRVLTAYEHYALKLLHVWRHWLGDQG